MANDRMNELLWRAVEAGALKDIIAAVGQGADVNARDEGGETALTRSTGASHTPEVALACVQSLLKLGARVSEERPDGGLGTSVHRAAAHGHTQALKELFGADGKTALELFDDMGRTPLICAVQEGHLEEASLILDAGANVDSHDEKTFSNTALATAVQERNVRIVELLLKHGADPTIQGWMQLSALDRARDWNADDADPELRRIFDLLNNAARLGKRQKWLHKE